ncbi:MAG: L,D-transpeptidase family protein [Planctomycetota bacterium]
MKTIQNSLFIVFVISVFSALSSSDVVTSTGITHSIVYANAKQALPLLLAKKDEDIVIYKKDIIIRSDELKSEPKRNQEEFKTVEKPEAKKQETLGLDIIDKYIKEGKKYEARNALSDIFINKKIPEKQKEIKEQLDRLNEDLIFSPSPSPDAVMYTVQPGDVLARIAKQFNTNYELIMKINGKATTRLNIGEKLKILTGKTKILASKTDFTLTLLLNDHYVKQYRIGTGKNDKTPVGTFEVKNKIKEPTWYSPNGGVFPYGHQENILGTRWIGFKDKPDVIGYGIHGTTLPETIGTASSNGCVRMINGEVEELFDFVTLDTEIIIQR